MQQPCPAFLVLVFILSFSTPELLSGELHVAKYGKDLNSRSKSAPLLTIGAAAERAQPGDTITVHAGVYRERVNPPRGGDSDKHRITYLAAKAERVVITGSEIITNWVHVQGQVWKAEIPNSFFGTFNPYTNLIHGDWFNAKGRAHHTGAVYVNGDWLIEATKLEEVLADTPPGWLCAGNDYLLNIAWLDPGKSGTKLPAEAFAVQSGIQTAPCSEGGKCIGFIESGDWVRYDGVDLGENCTALQLRGASATKGGVVEVRLNSPDGQLLGSCFVPHTGGWQSWATVHCPIAPTSERKNLCLAFKEKFPSTSPLAGTGLWFAEIQGTNTVIWARLGESNPNSGSVEINVRQSVFYPDAPWRNYITVLGFELRNASTPWAPPTAQQIGLIGTHWSKGWIIEDNVISHSVCSGVSLGKYGDQWDNTSANTAEGYVKTIERALQNGWNRETIGHHIVRNNSISHCEQAGIVGSLGAAFCVVSGNTISHIHERRLFTGAEMAGIKFHAAIDTVISGNRISQTCLGLWLDWMAQGTRVSGNLFTANDRDLFVEVDHGPFLVDNNLFLSDANLLDMSEGGAYAHNLFKGRINSAPEPRRDTPFHPPHSTAVAGLTTIRGGDDRFYNNIFIGPGPEADAGAYGLAMYDAREYPLFTGGNIYFSGARPYKDEPGALVLSSNPNATLVRNSKTVFEFTPGSEMRQAKTVLVNTELLGKAKVSGAAYENGDGTPLTVNRDFTGKHRSDKSPTPGPFEFKPGRDQFRCELK